MTNRLMKMLSFLIALTLLAAACGSDSDDATPATTIAVEVSADEAAMEDDAMEDDAMEDDAMEDDAMEDDAMEDDAMEDDAMEDDVMEDDAMEAMAEGVHVLHLELSGLEAAPGGKVYQAWSTVDGEPVAGGAFNIEGGEVKVLGGQDHLYIFDDTTAVFITVESEDFADGNAPSGDQVLAGDVDASGNITLAATNGAAASGTGETR